MSDPNEKCRNCGAPRSAHRPAKNGGLDCPPRADGRVPIVVGHDIVGMDDADHCAITAPRIEWRDPIDLADPALAVLREAHEGAADGKGTKP